MSTQVLAEARFLPFVTWVIGPSYAGSSEGISTWPAGRRITPRGRRKRIDGLGPNAVYRGVIEDETGASRRESSESRRAESA